MPPIGINWKPIWMAVWKAVWTNVAPTPSASSTEDVLLRSFSYTAHRRM